MTKKLKKLAPDHARVDGNIKWYTEEMAKQGLKAADETNLPPVVNPRKDDQGVSERDMYESLCRNEFPMVSLCCF